MKLDEMLGFDSTDPGDRHAEILVDEHDAMLKDLIAIRERSGLDQKDVAILMGIDPSGVSRIEAGDRDLHLSTLRRYAFAVGAVIHHEVEPFSAVQRREAQAAAVSTLRTQPAAWATLHEVMTAASQLTGPRR